jgi:hypothetical protein
MLLTSFIRQDKMATSSLNMKSHWNIFTQRQATSGLRRSGVFCAYSGVGLSIPNMPGESPDKLARRRFTD